MAQSKELSRYSSQFFTIAKAIETKREFSIECQTRESAQNLRFQFYGFRKAALHAGMEDLYPNLAGCVVSIRETRVEFKAADNTDIARILDSAIAQLSAEDSAPTTAASVAKPQTQEQSSQTQESLIDSYINGEKNA